MELDNLTSCGRGVYPHPSYRLQRLEAEEITYPSPEMVIPFVHPAKENAVIKVMISGSSEADFAGDPRLFTTTVDAEKEDSQVEKVSRFFFLANDEIIW